MMRKIITGAALLGLAIPAAAQIRVEGSFGRQFHVRAAFPVAFPAPCAEPAGHWETVTEQVLVPGFFREERLPPRYGWAFDRRGHRHWTLIDDGCCQRVWVPEHYEMRSRQVWVSC